MGWELQGEDYILRERTRKPFERFKIDATRGLLTGLAAFFTTHKWEGTTCHIDSLGAKGDLTLEHGVATLKMRFVSFPATFLQGKILSDVEATMTDVCGVISAANRNVFIVHGHDELARSELKNFLTQLDLQPFVLDEQNVIMELGWFMAHLGRERVILLYHGELEIPSDIHGVVYLKFNNSIYEISERIRQRLKGVGLISLTV